MQWIDTHTHIYFEEMGMPLSGIVTSSLQANVCKLLLPCVDSACVPTLLQAVHEHPTCCYAMLGLHPCYVDESYEKQLHTLATWLHPSQKNVIAIGEIGLDFYHDTTYKNEQESAFRTQLAWSETYQLPISVHSRNATPEAWAILQEVVQNPRGVFHCYSGDEETAVSIVSAGMYLGIGGAFTYPKNEPLRRIVKRVGIEHIVLETDAPYLAPVPFRGKTNTPAYIPSIGQAIASYLNISLEEVAQITTENAQRIFGLGL